MVGVMGGMFSFIAVGICGPFLQAGMDWLYFALMGLMAVFIGAFGSVFNTYSSLYLAKDNDLLLAMPIPVRCIMASRLLSVYLMGLMYSARGASLPAVIIYWIFAPLSVGEIVGSVLLVLLVSLIVMILSCAAGVGGGKNQPEAEKQERDHGSGFTAVLCGVLFRLFQGAELDIRSGGKCRGLWRADQK